MAPLDIAPRNTGLDEALADARERYTAARPNSAAAHVRAKAVMPGGNTRTTLFYTPFPTAMAGGEGCHLTDIDGHRYLDLCGEYTAGLFGHSDPRIIAALEAAIARGLSLASVGEREAQFAEILCARFPSVERIRFTNSGTEANLMAIAAARGFTGREGILAMQGGYHGGVLTFVTGANPVNAPFPVTLAPYNDIDGTLSVIREKAGTLAAILLEPMMGSGGCIPATRDFLAALRAAATEHNIVLIFDEVMTSRHTLGGLQKLHGITPDLTTLGKYVAGGMSFGAFGGRADIMAMYEPGRLTHAGTFNNNVLSMSAGITAMGDIFDDSAAEALRARGDALRDALNATCAKHGASMQFTGIGSMIQPHFRLGDIIRPYVPSPAEEGLRELFFLDMMSAGIYIARRGMVALSLPVGESESAQYVAAVDPFCAARKPLLKRE
ncbi:aspartate aminotransferase family protein [Plastoroseomonas arctica]|uniref:Aminotransferase class III-fold pyridoxal phosphate-dependent enzyme n=1 Tax=Plastoroseomonas arctica TaxID=1509237 RepID=A0AAF1JYY6_9PROT|nr:aminotransferase class III-fold pyridoxal phosphate-dependent enzyme [Plastoroseomonas arctica]MBR0653868.1 aminotransferase class III-fold pyridoxal phosphate-dependent enzyme [Plastoroseomonas arctica]